MGRDGRSHQIKLATINNAIDLNSFSLINQQAMNLLESDTIQLVLKKGA